MYMYIQHEYVSCLVPTNSFLLNASTDVKLSTDADRHSESVVCYICTFPELLSWRLSRRSNTSLVGDWR